MKWVKFSEFKPTLVDSRVVRVCATMEVLHTKELRYIAAQTMLSEKGSGRAFELYEIEWLSEEQKRNTNNMDEWLVELKNDLEKAHRHIRRELELRMQKRIADGMAERLRCGWFNEEPSGILSQESIDKAKSL